MSRRFSFRFATFAAAAAAILGAVPYAAAQESIRQEQPTPSSVEESVTPIDRLFSPRAERPVLFPQLRDELADQPQFIRDAKVDVNLRVFDMDRSNFDGSKSHAWAGGGALSLQSGYLLDALAVGGVVYTSQPIYAPLSEDGTLLLQTGQRGYTALGQAYARVKFLDTNFLNLYRYAYNTPFIDRDDSRMSPNTFEGYTMNGTYAGADDAYNLRYGAGYITKMKPRNAENFISMSKAAGASVDRGVAVAGALYTAGQFSLGAINYFSNDIINIGYAESKYNAPLLADVHGQLAMQYTNQRSVGGNLLTGSSFATDQFGFKVEMSRDRAILSFAYSIIGDGADIQKPWSGNPIYTGAMDQNYNRAGEQALLVKASYDFADLGLAGVTAYALYVHGWTNVAPPGKPPVTKENELDLDLQWRPQWDGLNGLWLRARYGYIQLTQGTQTTQRDLRLIFNYDIAAF